MINILYDFLFRRISAENVTLPCLTHFNVHQLYDYYMTEIHLTVNIGKTTSKQSREVIFELWLEIF